MRVYYKTRPYEAEPGSANALFEKWEAKCIEDVKTGKNFKKNIYNIVHDFDTLPLLDIEKPRVGIVGEILVKFLPTANNHLVDLLEAEGAEAVCPDLVDFFLYSCYNSNYKVKYFGKSRKSATINNMVIRLLEFYRRHARKALEQSKRFEPMQHIETLAEYAEPFVSIGNMTGEGWFLTGEW